MASNEENGSSSTGFIKLNVAVHFRRRFRRHIPLMILIKIMQMFEAVDVKRYNCPGNKKQNYLPAYFIKTSLLQFLTRKPKTGRSQELNILTIGINLNYRN